MQEARRWRVSEIVAAFYFLAIGVVNPVIIVFALIISGMGMPSPSDPTRFMVHTFLISILILAMVSFVAAIGIFIGTKWGIIFAIIVSVTESIFLFQMFTFPSQGTGVTIDFLAFAGIAVLIFFITDFFQKRRDKNVSQ